MAIASCWPSPRRGRRNHVVSHSLFTPIVIIIITIVVIIFIVIIIIIIIFIFGYKLIFLVLGYRNSDPEHITAILGQVSNNNINNQHCHHQYHHHHHNHHHHQ